MLFQLLVVIIKVAELLWQDVSVGRQVESRLAELFLHADHVEAEAVLLGDLVTIGELVNLLVLVQALVLVRLARAARPQQVPLVAVGLSELVGVEQVPHHLVFKPLQFEQELRIFNVKIFTAVPDVRAGGAAEC